MQTVLKEIFRLLFCTSSLASGKEDGTNILKNKTPLDNEKKMRNQKVEIERLLSGVYSYKSPVRGLSKFGTFS